MKLSNRVSGEAGPQDFNIGTTFSSATAQPSEHIVQFYESDEHLVRCIADFIGERFSGNTSAILIATAEHLQGIEAHLRNRGYDLASLRRSQRYTALDAHEKLGELMPGNELDESVFVNAIGDLVRRACDSSSNVIVFGELVAILMKENRAKHAIRIEQLWNDIARIHRFSLLCAYPIKSFADDSRADSFLHVCREHNRIVPTEDYHCGDTEAERVDSVIQLQRRNASYEAKLAERRDIEKAMESEIAELETFCHTLSHDMRSPLRAIQDAASTLLHDHAVNIGSAGVHELQRIERATIRLQTLLRDVLAYTKAAHGEIDLKPIALGTFIKDLIEDHPEFDRSRDAIKVDSPLHDVVANRPSLEQCLTNLIGNALKFVSPGINPEVRIHTRKIGAMVRVSVVDNGIGVRPEHRDRIFQVFGRVHPETRYPGNGIGLALVKKAAARMGGETGFESQEGKGSTFWFTLPSA